MEYNGENIKELLQDAALKGDVTILRALLGQDPLLLHRPSNVHPLHTTSRLGHLQFTEELLRINPSLAEELDPIDKSSPLHLASGNGHVDVVKALVSANAYMSLARDVHGRNPAHVAAMKGHVFVLEELIRVVPAVARERVGGGGEGIMHLCVKFNQVEALRLVAAKAAAPARMLLNATDGDGNTALHIAVADQRPEIIKLLRSDNRVEENMQNGYGLTAKDIFTQNNKDGNNTNPGLSIILGGRQAKLLSSKEMNKKKEKERQSGWIQSQRKTLMVVASLVATMAFQAGLTPPFLEQKDINIHPLYNQFVIFNTIGLVSSTSSIILLISGLPGRRFFMIVVLVMMWVSLTSMTYVYGISLRLFTLKVFIERSWDSDEKVNNTFYKTYIFSFCAWACVMALILLGHLVTWTVRFCKKLGCLVKKIRLCC